MPNNRKRDKDGYFRETITTREKTASGNPKRITIRDKDWNKFKRKLGDAKRLHDKGVSLTNMTVEEWGQRWLEVYKANASPKQKAHYAAKLNIDILPEIGAMPIKDVRPTDIQRLLNKQKGRRDGTVKKIRVALQQLFGDAEAEGIIERTPAGRLELPELVEKPRRPLTQNERAIVCEVAKTHKRGAYVLTLMYTGIRRGECVALKVKDVDLSRPSLSIVKRLRMKGNKGEEDDGTKASTRSRPRAGIRVVPIPNELLPVIQRLCKGKKPDDLLFPKEDGKHATNQAMRIWWGSFLRQCHLVSGAKTKRNAILLETSNFDDEVTPHYLRHTYATDLFAAGVDEPTQEYFLGHTSNKITDVYRKMNDTAFDRALELMNAHYETLDYSIKTFSK